MKDKVKKFFSKNPKLRNPYFWLGLISTIFAAAGVTFESLTSWALLGAALMSIIQNPVAIVAVIGAVVAIFNDNSTKGLDKITTKKGSDK